MVVSLAVKKKGFQVQEEEVEVEGRMVLVGPSQKEVVEEEMEMQMVEEEEVRLSEVREVRHRREVEERQWMASVAEEILWKPEVVMVEQKG